jgi:hypothetical protein
VRVIEHVCSGEGDRRFRGKVITGSDDQHTGTGR